MIVSKVYVMACLLALQTGCAASNETPAAIGAACYTRGQTGECVAGAVCDTIKDNQVVCLKICEKDEQCASTESCSGVSGTTGKACHAK